MWLFAALTAYFLFALVTLTDKYLLKERVPNPKVFIFYIGLLGLSLLTLAPFRLIVPSPFQIFFSLSTGAVATVALFIFFVALKQTEASRIAPVIGALIPLFSFFIVYFILNQKVEFGARQIFAFLVLVSSGFLITWHSSLKAYRLKIWVLALFSAFLFAIAYIMAKYVYLSQPFLSGIIWTRIGAFLIVLPLLFFKEVRESLSFRLDKFKSKQSRSTAVIFIAKTACGGLANLLQQGAIALASISYIPFINALLGVQYPFLLIFAFILTKKFPMILKEEFTRPIFLQKTFGILLICLGIFLLAFH